VLECLPSECKALSSNPSTGIMSSRASCACKTTRQRDREEGKEVAVMQVVHKGCSEKGTCELRDLSDN
jgi:hypothetical protein